jgi:SAM-dependent MidA family methyltransferase
MTTPLTEALAARIAAGGPIPFSDFMRTALYDPEHGYYRSARDPFGKEGDFFTAAQLQPVFGILIAARIRLLRERMGDTASFTVVELGAGRGEMAEALSEFDYVPIESGRGELPARVRGVIFSNEFFDALPVERAVWRKGRALRMRVGANADGFHWVEGEPVSPEEAGYIERYFPPLEDGSTVEIHLESLEWIRRIAAALESGFHFTIDYGFTRREAVRFPQGTLMSYRRHTAREDVLEAPGTRDITSHAPFSALEEYGAEHGLQRIRFEALSRTLLDAGERDQFAAALRSAGAEEDSSRRLQLKTLLFGMGETFRTLIQRKQE